MAEHNWPQQAFTRLLHWVRTYKLSSKFAVALSVAALISGIATYLALTKMGPFEDKTRTVLPFIYLDLTLLLLLAVVIAKRLVELWVKRRKGLAGSKLHIHMAVLFALVSVIPAISVAVFSAFFFNVGVQAWFSEPVRAALTEAREVAQAYVEEHKKAISRDIQVMANDLRPDIPYLTSNPKLFSKRLSELADKHGLIEALVFNGNQQIVARSYFTFALELEKILLEAFQKAKEGEIPILSSENGDRVRAIIKLDPLSDTYLYVGKLVDHEVLQHLSQAKGAIAEYNRLESQRSGLQITFILFFLVVALLLLLAAIWVGLTLATWLAQPISQLIEASEEVSRGNLSIQIDEESFSDELASLMHAFNRMTTQLFNQRHELIQANNQLDRRRQFTETVLADVSAGVIGLDAEGKIYLPNRRASELLTKDLEANKGRFLHEVAPELAALLQEAAERADKTLNRQITIKRRGFSKILQVCVVVERPQEEVNGYIITFDDITALLMAQRKAAWSDEARKIAHEIKNPLTPIQLSAERLKRRYLKEITSDPKTFESCINTIIRQVEHIGKLVAEFSSFARMPEPIMKNEDLNDICQQAFFLQRQAHPEIQFFIKVPAKPLLMLCDAQQMSQLITNLLQNAIDALINHYKLDAAPLSQNLTAQVHLSLKHTKGQVLLTIEDNGPGFPKEGRERLIEPYYTTRAKGTGLGLAIVAKIVEDHHGRIELGDSSLGGACVTLRFNTDNLYNIKEV